MLRPLPKVEKHRKPRYLKMKHTFRVRARDPKDRLLFFKTRTKQRTATIKRLATIKGLLPERITV